MTAGRFQPFNIHVVGQGISELDRPTWRVVVTIGDDQTNYAAASWAEVDAIVVRVLREQGHDEIPLGPVEHVPYLQAHDQMIAAKRHHP